MAKALDIDTTQPTPVEEDLVAAIRQREGWPFVYAAMRSVTKEDLLADARYCARHKNPSLTQFFTECGALGGLKISMMRKYQKAGRFYDGCRERFPSLPPVTDASVCALSPDSLVLVERVASFLDEGAPQLDQQRNALVHLLVAELLEGRGLERKQMLSWLGLLQDASRAGQLERSVADFMAQVESGASGSRAVFEAASATQCLASRVRAALLQNGASLFGSAEAGAVSVVDALQVAAGSSVHACSFAVVVQQPQGVAAVHAISVCEAGESFAGHGAFPGADGTWLVVEGAASVEEVQPQPGVGVLAYEGGALSKLREAPAANASAESRCALLEALVSRLAARTASAYSYTCLSL